MYRAEIDRIFTAKVAEYIANGWTIRTEGMSGSQGEEAKVDLTDGMRIIRILMESKYTPDGDFLIIRVGRSAEAEENPVATIWNQNLSTIQEMKWGVFRRGTHKWYVSPDEYTQARTKWLSRPSHNADTSYDLGDKARQIVLPFVRRQPRCKSVQVKDIAGVTKTISAKYGVSYTAFVKGKVYRLR